MWGSGQEGVSLGISRKDLALEKGGHAVFLVARIDSCSLDLNTHTQNVVNSRLNNVKSKASKIKNIAIKTIQNAKQI